MIIIFYNFLNIKLLLKKYLLSMQIPNIFDNKLVLEK